MTEQGLFEELTEFIGSVDTNLIGMREEIDKKVEKYYRYQLLTNNQPLPEMTTERKESDLRRYAQIVFNDGTLEEKHAILKPLKGKMLLKDKKVYVDSIPDTENVKMSSI